MILREYQKELVAKAVRALAARGNTLVTAPTGSGKTVMLSALVQEINPKRTLILQHRDELLAQNARTFRAINPLVRQSIIDASTKDYTGQAMFAMVQTLTRHTDDLPPVDLLIVDEAHHAIAPTYQRIHEAVKSVNGAALVAGFTATPARGDGKGLRKIFDNCCGRVGLKTLIENRHLVPPKTFVIRLEGVPEALQDVRKTASGEYDLEEVSEIMNRNVHNQKVVNEWKRIASGRRTIVFCSTVQHAFDVMTAFVDAGIRSDLVTGETPEADRRDILSRFDRGEIDVLCNVAVLTEGYDSQAASCIILLRPCSYKSTMIQMIGRGLRTVTDTARYPGVVKTDCMVLDFGTSLLTHGDLESGIQLDDKMKICPNCGAEVPLGTMECPICGAVFERVLGDLPRRANEEEDEDAFGTMDAALVEVNLLKKSPFRWCDIYGGGKVLVAAGFAAKAFVTSQDGQLYYALGLVKGQGMRLITTADKCLALAAADDFMSENETEVTARKNKRWLNDVPTLDQLNRLHQMGYSRGLDLSFTKYSANCHLWFNWAKTSIERAMR